jgi:hypothetical protein
MGIRKGREEYLSEKSSLKGLNKIQRCGKDVAASEVN